MDRVGGFPLRGKLALRTVGGVRDLVEEVKGLELLLADKVRVLFPLIPTALGLILPLICPVFPGGPGIAQEGGEVAVGVEVEGGTPSLGTDRLVLPLLPKLAPQFSLESPALDPTELKLSHLSRDIWLP